MTNAIVIEPKPFEIERADQLAAKPAANLRNDHRGVIWQSPAGPYTTLVVDLGSDQSVDTVMLFGLWGNIPATASVIVAMATDAQGLALDGSNVDSGGSGPGSYYAKGGIEPFAGGEPISVENGVFLWQTPVGWPPVRYVSLLFSGLTDGGYIRASRLVVGKAIELERNFSFGAGFGVKDLGSLEFSRRGVLLRNRGAKLRTTSLSFTSVRKDEVEQLTKPLLERIGNTECVALVTDPAPDAQRQNRCYFGPLVGDLSQTWRRAGAWETKINMVSIF